MTNPLVEAAKRIYDSGIVVLPALRKEKRPVGSWKRWTKERPKFEDVFNARVKFDAICVLCGAISGGLEILDFDQNAVAFDAYVKDLKEAAPELTRKFERNAPVAESTQSGGKHLAFRSSACGRNQKLACDANGGVLIETRGEGGICLIAPTDGYVVETGDWANVPTIAPEERAAMFEVARTLDLFHAPRYVQTSRACKGPDGNELRNASTFATPSGPSQGRLESAADYLRRDLAPLRDSLRRAGWRYLRTEGDFEQWERPDQPVAGKPGGSLNVKDRYFYCFTSNGAPFEPNKCYSPLDAIATLDFGGNVSEASKAFAPRRSASKRIRAFEFYNDPTSRACERPDGDARVDASITATPSLASQPRLEKIDFPRELLECGGLVGELADVANRFAIRPQPEGAFLAGLSCVSYLAGRSFALNYAGTLVTPNLYSLFLAPSGMGKEVLRRVCSSVAFTYKPDEPVPESFASVQALQNMTSRVRKLFWLHDEFGRDLATMAGRQPNVNISGVITESLKLYSNANNRSYLPKLVASEAKGTKRPDPVDRPSLTIFATGNPTEFYEATTEAVLRNGYVSRFTIVYGRIYSEKRKTTFDDAKSAAPMALSPSLQKAVLQWRDYEATASDPTILTFDQGAFDCVSAYDEETEKQIRLDVFNSDGVTEMKARLFEKAWKYALLFKLSERGARPNLVVDRKAAELAIALVDYEARQFAKNAKKFAASDVSALASDVLEFIRANNGVASLSQITRKFQRQDKRRRDEALATLVDADYVDVADNKGKRVFVLSESE